MDQKELSTLNDEELRQQAKKMRSAHISFMIFFGVMIGIAIYTVVKNGTVIFILFPLFFAPMAIHNRRKNRAVQQILKERKLK